MGSEPTSARIDPTRERDLLDRARVDGAAFGELYDAYLPRLYGFVFRRVGERSVAEDVTTASFEQALAAVRGDDFKNGSFRGSLYRVAADAIVEHVRSVRQLVPVDGPSADRKQPGGKVRRAGSPGRASSPGRAGSPGRVDSPGRTAGRAVRVTGDEAAFEAFAGALDGDRLSAAIRRLPESHRRVLILRFYDDLEIDEICGLLGCTQASFAVKLHRALGALRGALLKESTDAA